VKFFASQIYAGKMTQKVREQFELFTRQALKQYISDQVNERLKTALSVETAPTEEKAAGDSAAATTAEPTDSVITTEEETEAYHIIRAILRETVPVKRIVMRDVQRYCGILLDDNNRKPICRLYFNAAQRSIGFFDSDKETRVPLANLDELYKHAERLKATVARYDAAKAGQNKVTA